MLNRRKRIPLEPEGIHAKRPDTSRRTAERHWLNRRMFLAKGAVAAGFVALGGRLAQLQLVEKNDYQAQADDYTQNIIETKAPRGLIYDRAGRPVAENRRTWAVQVTPALLPDATEAPDELKRVKDTLVSALQLNQVLIVDPEAVPIGSEETVYARIGVLLQNANEEGQQKWIDQLKADALINYVVLCDDNLSPDMAATFRAAAQELPGVSVVSYLDYLLLNSWSGLETPITVAKDVPKDIAMKLEANKVMLPGVSIDDSAMARTYPAGPLMAHMLGFVALVNQDDVESEDNRNSAGKPIYNAEDFIGKDGLEYTQEKLLRGTKGIKTVEVDANGVVQRTISVQQEPVPGKNIHLTVDLEIQSVLRQAIIDLAEYANEDRKIRRESSGLNFVDYDCGSGAVVMMDVRNGELIGLVSYPDFDNQLYTQNPSQRQINELQSEEAKTPLVNRTIGNFWAPGSTIKPYMAASALREKVIDENTTFECHGGIALPTSENELVTQKYRCWATGGHSGITALDVHHALEQSCDVFFYNVGTSGSKIESTNETLHYYDYSVDSGTQGDRHDFQGMGIAKIHENLTKRFWFGQYTGIDLPGEVAGLVPDDQWLFDTYQDYWSPGDTVITSIGQGNFLATPLQMALNTAAIANDGTLYKPMTVKSAIDEDGKVTETKIEKLREIKINKNYLRFVREGMWGVVNDEQFGTAYRNTNTETYETFTKWPLTNPDGEDKIEIAGKTGTAEFGEVNKETRVYDHQHAWFTAFAPYDNPEIAVAVFLEDGGEGSSYAVPIADRAIRAYFELTGKRPRGLMLREDKQPITDASPAPNPDALKLVPGDLVATADR